MRYNTKSLTVILLLINIAYSEDSLISNILKIRSTENDVERLKKYDDLADKLSKESTHISWTEKIINTDRPTDILKKYSIDDIVKINFREEDKVTPDDYINTIGLLLRNLSDKYFDNIKLSSLYNELGILDNPKSPIPYSNFSTLYINLNLGEDWEKHCVLYYLYKSKPIIRKVDDKLYFIFDRQVKKKNSIGESLYNPTMILDIDDSPYLLKGQKITWSNFENKN